MFCNIQQKITVKKLKFSINDFFSKYDQRHIKLQIWSHLMKKSLMENFNFCAENPMKKGGTLVQNDINQK